MAADSTASTAYHFDGAGVVVHACHLRGHVAYGVKGIVTVVSR